jgi:4-hydroxybenzoate polyprenyltransferase
MKRWLLKLEALWWMSRAFFSAGVTVVFGVAGWLTCDESPELGRLAAFVGYFFVLTGATHILNDLLDNQADLTTAPHLPLASGLVSRWDARLAILVCLAGCTAVLARLSVSWADFAVAALLTSIVVVGVALYSATKSMGAVGSLVMLACFAVAPLIGAVVSGREARGALGPVVVIAGIAGFCTNVMAALRDVDTDPAVGNRTLPVRIGARRALALVAFLCGAAAVSTLVLAGTRRSLAGAVLTGAAALVLWVGYRQAMPRITKGAVGLEGRVSDTSVFAIGTYVLWVAVPTSFSWIIGASVGLIFEALFLVGFAGYRRRILGGGLHEAALRLRKIGGAPGRAIALPSE